jgi:hypothetical protein
MRLAPPGTRLKVQRFIYYMLLTTPKNPIEKIGENYQHRNIFDVFIEKLRWKKSGNKHNHVLILPH